MVLGKELNPIKYKNGCFDCSICDMMVMYKIKNQLWPALNAINFIAMNAPMKT
jgi:hypothetical protein